MAHEPQTRQVRAVPLTREAFAPFGDVIEHAGPGRRRHLDVPFEHGAMATRPAMWVSRAGQACALPCRLQNMERHPHSAQSFIPLSGAPYLVVVAPEARDGTPDLGRLQAFVAAGSQGVCYRPGVWHHGLSVLQAPAEFAVVMTLTGTGEDDEFWPMPRPVDILPPEAACAPEPCHAP
ncbi:ureidoglycolate lyase [Orrella sp. JC864]|uniref:ureidoglycolate lyase n=1 Tax=Orrella sp. JC864 TaxID=3120298 RepID=UPI00300AEB9D